MAVMDILSNALRGQGLTHPDLENIPWPAADATAVQSLLARCPRAGVTPLRSAPGLAVAAGVGDLLIKDERARMGLGSFKALGAAYVIACDAEAGRRQGEPM